MKAHKGEIIWLGDDGEGRVVSTGKDEKMMVSKDYVNVVLGAAYKQEGAKEALQTKK